MSLKSNKLAHPCAQNKAGIIFHRDVIAASAVSTWSSRQMADRSAFKASFYFCYSSYAESS